MSPGTSVISATLNGVSGSTVLTVTSTLIPTPTPTSTPLVTVSSVQVVTNKKHRVIEILVGFSAGSYKWDQTTTVTGSLDQVFHDSWLHYQAGGAQRMSPPYC